MAQKQSGRCHELDGWSTGTAAKADCVQSAECLPVGSSSCRCPFTPSTWTFIQASRSRLPLIKQARASEPAVAAIDLHGALSHLKMLDLATSLVMALDRKSLEASVGLRLMVQASLVTAREHDAQISMDGDEPLALKAGLEPAIVDAVRLHGTPTDLARQEAVIIAFGRELFDKAQSVRDLRSRLGRSARDLVNLVSLMAQHAADAVLLAAFDRHLPLGEKTVVANS